MAGTPVGGAAEGRHAIACRSPRHGTWYLMRCLVLRDDRGRNAAALAYLVTALPCPRPDLGTALTTRASPSTATASAATALASVVDVLGKILAELARVIRTQGDLVDSAVEAERHGLGCLAPIEIVDEQHLNLLRHGSQPFC